MTTTRTPIVALYHGLIVLAVAWQGLWLLSEWLAGPRTAAVFLATVGWGALVLAIRMERLRTVLIAVDLGLILIGVAYLLVSGPEQQGQGITASTVVTGLIGLLLGSRWAAILISLVTGAEFLVLAAAGGLTAQDVLGPTYALAVGLGALLARLALVRGARYAMSVQKIAAERAVEVQALDQAATDLLASERIVHATVLNTLTAFGRGAVSDPSINRERAEQAAEVLERLTSGKRLPEAEISLAQEVAQQANRIRYAGIDVIVTWPGRAVVLPSDAEEAVRCAIDEAVTNVLRHARANQVRIEATAGAWGIDVRITDDGVGMARGVQHRIGIRDVIITGMERVGGRGEITRSGPGTCVHLSWRPASGHTGGYSQSRFILARFVAPFLFVFWAFTSMQVLIGWQSFTQPAFNAAAYALFSALAALLVFEAHRGPLRLAAVVVVLLAAPLVYRFQQLATPIGEQEWASEGIAALFIVLAGAGPPWAWPAVIVVWLVMQGDVLTEILAPGFAILLAIGLFSISFRRNTERADQAADAVVRNRAATVASQAVVAAIRGRAAIAQAGHAIGLLRNIARGHVNPESESVRSQCVAEERLLRIAMRLDPEHFLLHRLLGELAVLCYRRGIVLDVDVAATDVFDQDIERFRPVALQVLTSAELGDTVRVTTQHDASLWNVLLVVEGEQLTGSVSLPDGMSLTHMPESRMLLLEWRVSNAVSNRG